MFKVIAGTLMASAALIASPALAVDAFSVYNGTNGTGGFYYGTAVGTTLTDFTASSTSSCFLIGSTCMFSTTYGAIPAVGKGGTFSTVSYDGSTLAVHPLDESNNAVNDGVGVFSAFQATTTGSYRYSITLSSIGRDTTNGVGYQLFTGNAVATPLGTRGVLGNSGNTVTLTGTTVLAAGQRLGAIVDANGYYAGDTTAVTFGIAAVPEPAQWALMIGGFGMVGFAARRRRTLVAA